MNHATLPPFFLFSSHPSCTPFCHHRYRRCIGVEETPGFAELMLLRAWLALICRMGDDHVPLPSLLVDGKSVPKSHVAVVDQNKHAGVTCCWLIWRRDFLDK